MAQCKDCGAKIGFFDLGKLGRCEKCYLTYADQQSGERDALKQKDELARSAEQRLADAAKADEALAIESIILTTETVISLPIVRRIEVITAECAFGMNIFKDLFAGVRDIVGGRSETIQNSMREARRTTLYELKREAYSLGANAVVGVDLDYVELSSSGSMVMLVASGTAVEIGEVSEDKDEG